MKLPGQLRGEEHCHAKLTETKVKQIRTSDKGPVFLARKYNVTTQTIYNVLHKKTWRHVKGTKNVSR
jgi:Mor family transcriptional regulator